MSKIGIKPSKYALNLNYFLPTYVDKEKKIVNALIETNRMSLNKYERIFETGQLKLDRVGYSSIANPAGAYAEIPGTMDVDGDQLDVIIMNIIEPLLPGSAVEIKVIGIMKFEDNGEIDDKVIAVLSDDKRSDHIVNFEYFGEHVKKEMQYYWEHYKDLKKIGTGKVIGFFDADEAMKVINKCYKKFEKDIRPLFE